MVAPTDPRILKLASALILAGGLAACDQPQKQFSYSDVDTGRVLPEPKFAAREKCYGIALAQRNDCAAGKDTNCAGTAETDYMPDRWKYVAMGECVGLGGSLTEPQAVYKSEK